MLQQGFYRRRTRRFRLPDQLESCLRQGIELSWVGCRLIDFYKIQGTAMLCHPLVPVCQANTTGPRVTSSLALKYHCAHSSLVPTFSGNCTSAVRVVVFQQATCQPGRRSQTKDSPIGTSENLAGVAITGRIGLGVNYRNHTIERVRMTDNPP